MESRLFPISVAGRPCVALVLLCLLTLQTLAAAGQQAVKNASWQTYSPVGASFSMQIPGAPLPAQGHIFDSAYEKRAYRLIKNGVRSRVQNFEIEKGGRRSFLVSILEVRTAKRPHGFVTDSEVELINATIGDDIVHAEVERMVLGGGEVSQWRYNRKGGLGSDDKDDGIVYVKSRGGLMLFVVVDFDYADAGDTDIKAMLKSLRLHEGRAK